MEKKTLKIGHLTKVAKLPSNIKEYLSDRPFQMQAAKQVNRWLFSLYKRGIVGGITIGKHYNTLVLDITYQGSDIYINIDGLIEIRNVAVTTKKEFQTELEKYIQIEDNNLYGQHD